MMEKTRYQEINKQAKEYHKKYPVVWDLFVQYTFELIHRGFKHYGAKSIMERIRWNTEKPDIKGDSTFKINNNYTAFYARRFARMHPQYQDFFRFREQISKSKEATGMEELKPEDYQYI